MRVELSVVSQLGESVSADHRVVIDDDAADTLTRHRETVDHAIRAMTAMLSSPTPGGPS